MIAVVDRLLTWVAGQVAVRVESQLGARLNIELARHMVDAVLPEVQRQAEGVARAIVAERTLTSEAAAELRKKPLVGSELYLPSALVVSADGEYMTTSTPLTRDFLHPKFAEFVGLCSLPRVLHRKIWEWAFIYEQLRCADMLRPGRRGLGFGVGQEMLPALFAGCGAAVTATDSPADEQNWAADGRHTSSREGLFVPALVSREAFDERVRFEPCDMANIPPHLNGFDFCWSSCCFEHLGTLESGLDFVIASVERTLAVGGVACHTTEFNLSSDEETIETGRDVLYRKRDLLQMAQRLEDRGHTVTPLRIEPGDMVPDYLVDVPPYQTNPCLKLRVGAFVCTSIGLVIRRGR